MDTQPAWWQVLRHRLLLWLLPPDTKKPKRHNAKVSGAGTASAGLPGYADGDKT